MTDDPIPDIYGPRDIDLPFYRMYHGNMMFFPAGQLNTADKNTDEFGSKNDDAQQSACGIPDNAFFDSKVAIHPYFLKYADLSRYCMQDVCISFWKEDGTSDMMLKVTDICSTDPNDPTHCATPADIKIDRNKAMVMEHINAGGGNGPADPRLQGNVYPEKVWWFFMKCWADVRSYFPHLLAIARTLNMTLILSQGLAQPAYQGNNWFTTPALPNNLNQSQVNAQHQWDNNQKSYPAKGWPTYPNAGYNPRRDNTTSPPIDDWVPGEEPSWTPVAGGKGFGKRGSGSGGSSPNSSPGLNTTAFTPSQASTPRPTTFATSIISASNPSSPLSVSSADPGSSASQAHGSDSAAAVTATSFPYTFAPAPTGAPGIEADEQAPAADTGSFPYTFVPAPTWRVDEQAPAADTGSFPYTFAPAPTWRADVDADAQETAADTGSFHYNLAPATK